MVALIWIVAIGASVVLTVCLFSRRAVQNFTDKWPAIDDDEFVSRCTPGTRRDTALGVRRIVSDQLSIPYEHIHPEQSFVDDFDI